MFVYLFICSTTSNSSIMRSYVCLLVYGMCVFDNLIIGICIKLYVYVLYLCASVYMYYMHTYIHMCIHTYIHTYVHTYIHTCKHTCMQKDIHTYIHTYTHAHTVHTCVHTYIHTYIRTSIHPYSLTYLHTYMHMVLHIYIYIHVERHMHIHMPACVYIVSLYWYDHLCACARILRPNSMLFVRACSMFGTLNSFS